MGNCNQYIFNTSEELTKEAVIKFHIPIVKKNTLILSFKLTVGRIAITTEDMTTNEAIAHFNTKNDNILPYLYCYLKNYEFANLGSTSSIATATNSKAVKAMDFMMPTDAEVNDFYRKYNPTLTQILKLERINNKLTQLKNLYLKKFLHRKSSS